MIPRILVPKDARPTAAQDGAPPRRLSSDLDERTLIPSNLPHFELDGRTSIPSHIPLGVLSSRVVVPRNMPNTPLDASSNTPDYVQLTILESRISVPRDAHPSSFQAKLPVAIQDLPDVLDPDVINTGEVNFMATPVEARTDVWNNTARAVSIALHFAVILLILFGPGVFPDRNSTQNEIARDNLTSLYLPPDVNSVPSAPVAPPRPPSPQVHIDPRLLRKLAPPREPQPSPAPTEPERVVKEPPPVAAKPAEPVPAAPKPAEPESPIRSPQRDSPSNSLVLPRFSPGTAVQQSLHQALKDGGSASVQFDGPVGPAPGGSRPGGGGGGGGAGGPGNLGGSLELLTPTEGVDFTAYLNRVVASVKRNWFAVMPESALLGEQGTVVLQFRIMHNGVVPEAEPSMVSTSGKEPLDRAALSAIRSSTPFEPLPPAFSGPSIELRFIFLYNPPQNLR